jgi:coenzyme F420-dependent glucose-6-phosphate dehydrogenase
MAIIGYHASHEQFKPSDLLTYAIQAEASGFGAINCSDHFHPWSEHQGQSGFSFAWLGAAMQATKLPFGVVCAPGQRYHPAIVAQAAATLAEMFPKRFWMSIGSGEALNENITGELWLIKSERNARLLECFDIMKRLLKGKCVTHYGRVNVQEAKLYTLPEEVPLLLGAAVTKNTAAWMGEWADGLITIHRPVKNLKAILESFKNNGGERKPLYLKVQLSYARSEEEALLGAHDQWRTNIVPFEILDDLWLPKQFDAAAHYIRPEDMKDHVLISSNPKQHIEWIRSFEELGFEKIILHNVNRDQETFIKDFGEKVLPFLK